VSPRGRLSFEPHSTIPHHWTYSSARCFQPQSVVLEEPGNAGDPFAAGVSYATRIVSWISFLIATLLLLVIPALPLWPYSIAWGFIPSAVLGVSAACLWFVQEVVSLSS
jgi:hypothetical protein